ncbi:hypothetical protein L1987_46591 [Smallanthus sonchifolius]|uniref:Uncharacterized protein n=1 Tax=Smallanthus sonchifolius TaxID=185202 RepID=A0ACB9G188_9ASTR|nr:hypothetical protein L1987_46591 [Smallanthus sonchifolius]
MCGQVIDSDFWQLLVTKFGSNISKKGETVTDSALVNSTKSWKYCWVKVGDSNNNNNLLLDGLSEVLNTLERYLYVYDKPDGCS